MAIGKNKRLAKKGKGRKKKADAFEKKEWFRLKMPNIQGIKVPYYGWTPANRTAQGIHSSERLYNRVCTIRVGDLDENPKADAPEILSTATNIKLRIAKTENQEVYLDFHGLQLTRDKQCSLIRKWVTLVDAYSDIKTTDGFVFRVFAVVLTKKQDQQCKKTAYAQGSQVKRIRAKMQQIMMTCLGDKSTKEFVGKLLIDKCGDQFKKELQSIFPVRDCSIRKVKLIKRPAKEDLHRIAELHAANEDAQDDEVMDE